MTAVFCIEVAAIVFCLAAIFTTLIARLRRRWLQFLWPALLVWVPTTTYLALLLVIGQPARVARSFGRNLEFAPTFAPLVLTSLASFLIAFNLLPIIGLWRLADGAPCARRWRIGWLSAAVPGWAIAFIVSVAISDRHVCRQISGYRDEAEVIVQRGHPPIYPALENAATYYQPILLELHQEPELPAWLRWVGEPRFDPNAPEIRAYLDSHRALIDASFRAANFETCSFEGVMRRSRTTRFLRDEDVNMPVIGRLLLIDARAQAADGNWDACWERMTAAQRLCRHISNERDSDWQSWIGPIEGIRARITEALLADPARPKEMASAVFPIQVQDHHYRSLLARALTAERAGVTWKMSGLMLDSESLVSIGSHARGSPIKISGVPFLRVFGSRDDFMFYRDRVDRLVALLESPSTEWVGSLQLELDHWEFAELQIRKFHRFLPYYIDIAESTFVAESAASMTDVALAMEGYRAQQGEYPAELADLVPEYLNRVPIDPYGGQSVRMIPADSGVIVYTVGNDGNDHQGAESAKTDSSAISWSSDFTFCLGEAFRIRKVVPPEPESDLNTKSYPRIPR